MLIDKDLRLSISGCFWLFYASKYKVMSTKQIIAKVSLIFRNMIILYFEFLNYISDMSTKQLPK